MGNLSAWYYTGGVSIDFPFFPLLFRSSKFWRSGNRTIFHSSFRLSIKSPISDLRPLRENGERAVVTSSPRSTPECFLNVLKSLPWTSPTYSSFCLLVLEHVLRKRCLVIYSFLNSSGFITEFEDSEVILREFTVPFPFSFIARVVPNNI